MMKTAVGWHIELEFEEDNHRTRAAALVRLPDGNEVRAHGYASRHPPTPSSRGSARRSQEQER